MPLSVNRALRASARIGSAGLLLVLACVLGRDIAYAQNPGDPLFCQPNEGVAFLIPNGGAVFTSDVFTSNTDCYNGNISNDTDTTLATGRGGTMTHVNNAGGSANYTYTPPTAGFTGLDTFSIQVPSVWNSVGGTGSAGGSAGPGGPATLNITLNVIPATTTLSVTTNTATTVPVPAGSISGCSAVGNPGAGPVPGAVYGCITGIRAGTVAPSHGSLSTSGNTIQYTPTTGYTGSDTFTYQALGVNNDGTSALNSGDVTVHVTVGLSATPVPSSWILLLIGIAALAIFEARRRVHHPVA